MKPMKRSLPIIFFPIACLMSNAQGADEIVDVAVVAQSSSILSCDEREVGNDKLSGHWRLLKTRTDKPHQEYAEWPQQHQFIYKTYAYGRFFYYHYSERGELYESYGGHYCWLDANHIKEVIDYYAPFTHEAMYYGTAGQMTLSNGRVMVGAILTLSVDLDGEGNMHQRGLMQPNNKEEKHPDYYRERAVDQIYRQE